MVRIYNKGIIKENLTKLSSYKIQRYLRELPEPQADRRLATESAIQIKIILSPIHSGLPLLTFLPQFSNVSSGRITTLRTINKSCQGNSCCLRRQSPSLEACLGIMKLVQSNLTTKLLPKRNSENTFQTKQTQRSSLNAYFLTVLNIFAWISLAKYSKMHTRKYQTPTSRGEGGKSTYFLRMRETAH